MYLSDTKRKEQAIGITMWWGVAGCGWVWEVEKEPFLFVKIPHTQTFQKAERVN